MNPYLIYFIVLIVNTFIWTFFVLRHNQQNRLSLGLAGAWVATLVLAAFWQAEAIPWFWSFLQGILLVWLSAIILQVMAAATIWSETPLLYLPPFFCAVIGVIVNLTAFLHFLWIATVSPAGV
jgi:predicted neutral ceramidase superfamily lipid hydrolase